MYGASARARATPSSWPSSRHMASTAAGSGGDALGARKIALNGRNPMCSTTGEQVSAGTYLSATLLAAGSERMSLIRACFPYPMNPPSAPEGTLDLAPHDPLRHPAGEACAREPVLPNAP